MPRIRGKTYNGTRYRSKFETDVAKQLEEAGVKFEYETEKYSYRELVSNAECVDCGGSHVIKFHEYTPDFVIDNTTIVLEAKGRWTAADRKKIVSVCESNPGLDLRMVFQRDQKVTPNRAKKYSEWCEERGITYCVKEVPQEWLTKIIKMQTGKK